MFKSQLVSFKDIGHCIEVTDGKTRAVVSTTFGPRVLAYGRVGEENLFAELSTKSESEEIFQPYGGHRVWLAPEIEGRTNIADNGPCRYEISKGSVTVVSQLSKTQLETGIRLSFCPDGSLAVVNFIVNRGAFAINGSVWGISQLAVGGIMAVPFAKRDTGLMSNRTLSLWQYSDMTDERVVLGKDFVLVKADANQTLPFKYGMNAEGGKAYYFNGNSCFTKSFDYDKTAVYPNGNSNFECYVCGRFIESEAISPLKMIEPGQTYEYKEQWNIVPCTELKEFDEKTVGAAVLKVNQILAEG